VNGVDPNGLRKRTGIMAGSLENNSNRPVIVTNMDDEMSAYVAPGAKSPEGQDWDFVTTPDCKVTKMGGIFTTTVNSDGSVTPGVKGRPANEGETNHVNEINKKNNCKCSKIK